MIALIPARGGSKGLPGKNIIDFEGKPLIAHTIEAAVNASSVDEVYVSTDCPNILDVAISYGAKAFSLRPSELAQDDSRAIDTYLHFVREWEQQEGKVLESLAVLLPTCPLRQSVHIDEALSLFRRKRADSVISYTQEHHPVKWHKYLDSDGKFENIFPDTLNNRQKERISYYPNGAIFVLTADILKKGNYYSENSYAYVMNRQFSVDIDTADDLEMAKFLKRI